MTPLITVGINVYNGMPWLPETVESLRHQTYENFTVLVIDDGSTDGTCEYLRSIGDRRFQIVRQENHGITATLNRMLVDVETPWLVRQDADDVSFPHRLATLASYIEGYGDVGMFFSRAVHYQNGRVLGALKISEGTPEQLQALAKSGYLPSVCHSSVAFNVAKARAIGGYRSIFDVDYDMFWRMTLAGEARFIPETLVGYRLNTGSFTMQDTRTFEVEVLYVQYLLLSEIWGLVPESFAAVQCYLEGLIDKDALSFRIALRDALVDLGGRRYTHAVASTLRAFARAPRLFAWRLLYQFGLRPLAFVGEDPRKFRALATKLWPQGRATMQVPAGDAVICATSLAACLSGPPS